MTIENEKELNLLYFYTVACMMYPSVRLYKSLFGSLRLNILISHSDKIISTYKKKF